MSALQFTLEGSSADNRNKPTPVDFVPGVRKPDVVTECWVEGCCFEQRMISPDDHPVFRPLPFPTPFPGAEALNIHLSGFETAETVYLRRLIAAIGAQLSIKLNKRTTHLISATDDSAKARKAPEWGVKLVKNTWLVTSARSGRIESEAGHEFANTSTGGATTTMSTPASRSLCASATLNTSTVFELGEPTYERGKVPSATSTPAEQPSLSTSSRSLKAAPTYIDAEDMRQAKGPSSSEPAIKGDRSSLPSHILSPPKAETERILNAARGGDGEPQSLDAKILRTSSAPVNVMGKDSESAGSVSVEGHSRSPLALPDGPLAKKHVTDALRHIVGPAEITPSARKVRSHVLIVYCRG